MRVTIRNYQPVGYWVWDVKDPDDVCGICQNAFDGVCGGSCKEPGDACPLLFGTCTHVFHMHCILKWLEPMRERGEEGACPMCKRPWVEQVQEGASNKAADGTDVAA
ncbi:anaphase-promoting complex subunit 11 [Ceraceosorus bombacis]|uniref:Anaphase-promoting complex subunit 11 n=1 Tax=Ceraceosorus bombacis TaxID=401625 RepID=A0A0P1BMR8_9BASI|nr:anaphase-promoting complex subunit 11 [Ceraceosorus bombacis]